MADYLLFTIRLYVEVSLLSSNDKLLSDLIRILSSEQSDSYPAGIDATFFFPSPPPIFSGSLTMLWNDSVAVPSSSLIQAFCST